MTMKTLLVALLLLGSQHAFGGEIYYHHEFVVDKISQTTSEYIPIITLNPPPDPKPGEVKTEIHDGPDGPKPGEAKPRILGGPTQELERTKSRPFDFAGPYGPKHGVTEIGIERTACFGTCPTYLFIAYSDGRFRYEGYKHIERKGAYSGTFHPRDFHQLARYVKEIGYMELHDRYKFPGTDSPTTYTMVVMNGQRKTISNYGGGGPAKLWALEQLIGNMMSNANWDR